MGNLTPFKRNLSLVNRDFYDFYNALDDFFHDKWFAGKSLLPDTFKLDIQEKDKEYSIEAELPGIKKDEISVDLTEGKLNISVKREEKIDEEKKNYIHKERKSSSMSRSVYLDDAKPDGIKAKLDNGILSITVEKEEKPEASNKITIE